MSVRATLTGDKLRAVSVGSSTSHRRSPAQTSTRCFGYPACSKQKSKTSTRLTGPTLLTAFRRKTVFGLSQRAVGRPLCEATASPEVLQKIRDNALRLPEFNQAELQQALGELETSLGPAFQNFDKGTLSWFLVDRKLDVAEASAKLLAYDAWLSSEGFRSINSADVAEQASKKVSVLLPELDVLGRPVVFVDVKRHLLATRDLQALKQHCVYLLRDGINSIEARHGIAGGEGDLLEQTVLSVWDLRGFSTANADIVFLKFFVDVMFKYYPKRISQVLLIEPPFMFQPVWAVVKPLMGKYSSLVQFVKLAEAEEYLGMSLVTYLEEANA